MQGISVDRRAAFPIGLGISSYMVAYLRSHEGLVCAGHRGPPREESSCSMHTSAYISYWHIFFVHMKLHGHKAAILTVPRLARPPGAQESLRWCLTLLFAWILSPTLRWDSRTPQAGAWGSRLSYILPGYPVTWPFCCVSHPADGSSSSTQLLMREKPEEPGKRGEPWLSAVPVFL